MTHPTAEKIARKAYRMYLAALEDDLIQREAFEQTVTEALTKAIEEVREEERERIWAWAVDNGITDKKSFVALRDYLSNPTKT